VAAAGWTHGRHGDCAVLIVHHDAPADGFQRYTRKGSVDDGVASRFARDGAVRILHRQIGSDSLRQDAPKTRLRIRIAADVGERNSAIAGNCANPFGMFAASMAQRKT